MSNSEPKRTSFRRNVTVEEAVEIMYQFIDGLENYMEMSKLVASETSTSATDENKTPEDLYLKAMDLIDYKPKSKPKPKSDDDNEVVEPKPVRIPRHNTIIRRFVDRARSITKLISRLKPGRRRRNTDEKKSSTGGFTTLYPVTKEFSSFVSKKLGTKMARGEMLNRVQINKHVSAYIKKAELQSNPLNRREIYPDETLRTLLKLGDDVDVLEYATLQKYISNLYVKKPAA